MTLTKQLLEHLSLNPTASRAELSNMMNLSERRIDKMIHYFKSKGWIRISDVDGQRVIEVLKSTDSKNMTEFKQSIYVEMLPVLLEDFEQATNIDERNVIAKLIFKVLNNI